MKRKTEPISGIAQNVTPVRNVRRTTSPEYCSATTPCYVQAYNPACRVKDTFLHIASEVVRECIPTTELSTAIADLPKMERRVHRLQNLGCAFQRTVEAFRKLECRFDWSDAGQVQVLIPFREILQILGIVFPKANDEEEYEVVSKFCAAFGIGTHDIEDVLDGCYCMPAKNVIRFIASAGLPDALTERLTNWFSAFLAERVAGAPWSTQWHEDDVPF